MAKIGRNDPCPCGSGKKYKKCCLASDEAAARPALPAAVPERRPSLANYFQERDELSPECFDVGIKGELHGTPR